MIAAKWILHIEIDLESAQRRAAREESHILCPRFAASGAVRAIACASDIRSTTWIDLLELLNLLTK